MTATINASTTTGIVQSADTSGELALQSNGTTKLTVSSTGAYGQLVSGTAVASTSGTSIDFTSIPSWVKRITVVFNNVSVSATSNLLVQIGNGTPTTTGYSALTTYTTTAGSPAGTTATNGFVIQAGNASYLTFGSLVITNISGNIWTANGVLANNTGTSFTINSAGIITLGSALNLVRITTVNGTDTFDAGSINILYEG